MTHTREQILAMDDVELGRRANNARMPVLW